MYNRKLGGHRDGPSRGLVGVRREQYRIACMWKRRSERGVLLLELLYIRAEDRKMGKEEKEKKRRGRENEKRRICYTVNTFYYSGSQCDL